MENSAVTDSNAWAQKVTLSKILLLKYNLLHEFHVKQMECYIIACCNITVDGSIRISVSDKVVSYDLKTFKKYKKNGKETVKRNRFSFFRLFKYGRKKYDSEIVLAKENLTKWTKELLWGEDTLVKVVIDGREC